MHLQVYSAKSRLCRAIPGGGLENDAATVVRGRGTGGGRIGCVLRRCSISVGCGCGRLIIAVGGRRGKHGAGSGADLLHVDAKVFRHKRGKENLCDIIAVRESIGRIPLHRSNSDQFLRIICTTKI